MLTCCRAIPKDEPAGSCCEAQTDEHERLVAEYVLSSDSMFACFLSGTQLVSSLSSLSSIAQLKQAIFRRPARYASRDLGGLEHDFHPARLLQLGMLDPELILPPVRLALPSRLL